MAAARKPASTFGSRTDIGCVRDHNEDSLIVAPPLFAVADGMGGHAAGEVASEIAVNVLAEQAPAHPDGELLGRAVEAANRAILAAAHEGVGREGMGTTCTAAMLEGERLVIAQVGDSRAYLLSQGRLQQITRDHSLMEDFIEAGRITREEARFHPQRSVITRALGSDPLTQPDVYEINVQAGDRLILCSDGLSGMVEDSVIEAIASRTRDPQRCASQLVSEAITAGGHDNVTVVVADVTGFEEKRRRKMALKTKVSIGVVLALLAALIAGAGYALNTYISNVAYLAEKDGKVAIYRGVPGSFLGLEFSQLETVTDVNVDDLQPGTASNLRDGGVSTDGVEAAKQLVDAYREETERTASAVPAGGGKPASSPKPESGSKPDANAANHPGAEPDAAHAEDAE